MEGFSWSLTLSNSAACFMRGAFEVRSRCSSTGFLSLNSAAIDLCVMAISCITGRNW